MKRFLIPAFAAVAIVAAGGYTPGDPVDAVRSRSYYRTSSGAIEYCVDGNRFELGSKPVPADAASFVVVDESYAKDRNVMFFRSVPHPEVDVESFHIDRGVPKDRYHVYRDDNGAFIAFDDVDIPSFENVWEEDYRGPWALDVNRYYFRYHPIDVDRATFRKLNTEFYADKHGIYTFMQGDSFRCMSNKVQESSVVNDAYVRVADTLYFVYRIGRLELRTHPVRDVSSLRVVSRSTVCVDGVVLVDNEPFAAQEADAATIEQPKEFVPFLHRDRNHVCYRQGILDGVVPSTFRRSGDGWKDGNGNHYDRFGKRLWPVLVRLLRRRAPSTDPMILLLTRMEYRGRLPCGPDPTSITDGYGREGP
ncbi:MAG: DKNYY domain-containing protein ['Candidatus Kapabacteria' thiocyanatum]|uniref:DKNYY family protein n=1 Tax=Candidatus Kapaibacterium thiocyanatum TaxID=1895771 RepID=A0A1M3L2Z5_9BACT|nr:DKNYY domain-containing protein ['Candidatus Kapabacteria' thiocyanatum]OJX59683.1 MAG: hypothetical protein BGO89_05555 ['Candidatus Kapabacteria' thiocyanatum]